MLNSVAVFRTILVRAHTQRGLLKRLAQMHELPAQHCLSGSPLWRGEEDSRWRRLLWLVALLQ